MWKSVVPLILYSLNSSFLLHLVDLSFVSSRKSIFPKNLKKFTRPDWKAWGGGRRRSVEGKYPCRPNLVFSTVHWRSSANFLAILSPTTRKSKIPLSTFLRTRRTHPALTSYAVELELSKQDRLAACRISQRTNGWTLFSVWVSVLSTECLARKGSGLMK